MISFRLKTKTMAKVQTVKSARTDIYAEGLRTPDNTNKSGYTFDRSKPADKNDRVIVKKGETYYWWQFPHGSKQISATYPKPQQLTRSEYTIFCLDIMDRLVDLPDEPEDLESFMDEIRSEVEDHKSEIEDKLSNMPEGLQSGPTGELLQERIDELDNFISEIENIDFSFDEYEKEEYIREEFDESTIEEGADIEEARELWNDEQNDNEVHWDIDEKEKEETHRHEWIQEKHDEINSLSIG